MVVLSSLRKNLKDLPREQGLTLILDLRTARRDYKYIPKSSKGSKGSKTKNPLANAIEALGLDAVMKMLNEE